MNIKDQLIGIGFILLAILSSLAFLGASVWIVCLILRYFQVI